MNDQFRKLIAKVREDTNDIRAIAVKIQPSRLYDICQRIEARVEAALAADELGQAPTTKCDYPACANEREAGELYCIAHNRKHTAFPTREVPPPEGIQHPEWGYDAYGKWVRKVPLAKAEFDPKQEVRVLAVFEKWHAEGKDAYVRVEGIQQLVSALNLQKANTAGQAASRAQLTEKNLDQCMIGYDATEVGRDVVLQRLNLILRQKAAPAVAQELSEEQIKKLVNDIGNAGADFMMEYTQAKLEGRSLDYGLDSKVEAILRNAMLRSKGGTVKHQSAPEQGVR